MLYFPLFFSRLNIPSPFFLGFNLQSSLSFYSFKTHFLSCEWKRFHLNAPFRKQFYLEIQTYESCSSEWEIKITQYHSQYLYLTSSQKVQFIKKKSAGHLLVNFE